MFHFWSAKAGAVLLFCLWPLMALTGSEAWLPAAAMLVAFSRLEQILYIEACIHARHHGDALGRLNRLPTGIGGLVNRPPL